MTSNEVLGPAVPTASAALDEDGLVFDDSGTSSAASSRAPSPSKASLTLTPEEEMATKQFLLHVNGWRSARGYTSLSW
jgi:hypothetical protein